MGSSRFILVGLATLTGSSRLILVGLGNLRFLQVNHCQYSPTATGKQEGKAWLRIMRTHNAGVKVEIMFFFDLG
jgi:hypothetical protein